LLIADDEGETISSESVPRVDLRSIALQVLQASEAECAAHEAVLEQLDKASGGKTIWRIDQSTEKAVP
ncbi:MAG: DNA polymerase III subunit epsilon, partial [Giesbergeria sp.]|nr:DNA polymerase III subunit epsilon [Giesbergeria sp.]